MPAARKEDLIKWFQKGVRNNQSHMIVVCDTYDYDDYPVYINSLEEFEEEYKRVFSHSSKTIMEIYDLKIDINLQMNEARSFHYLEGFEISK